MSVASVAAKGASANEVLPACKLYLALLQRHGEVRQSELPELVGAGECWAAVYVLLNMSEALTEPFKFCPPGDAQPEQGVRVVVAYIEKRPERGRKDFTRMALEAL